MNDDITKLENFLKGLNKPSLSVKSRNSIRDGIVKNIYAEKKVGAFVREASQVSLSSVSKAELKEKLMAYVSSSRSFIWSQLFSYGKRFAGVLTLGTFLFGIFGFAFVDIKVASADSFTYIEDVTGDADVYRDGKELQVYPQMVLQKGDTVTTHDDSALSIKFLDQSIARLGEETTVNLMEIIADDENLSSTSVKIEVKNGVLWSRVINLINSNSTFSVKVGDIYTYAKKAAFNVSKAGNEAKVEVYSSVVNVVTTDDASQKVKSGESAIMNRSGENNETVSVVSHTEESLWVEQNLSKDVTHIAKVSEESAEALKNSVGVLPESPLYGFKDLKTGVVKLFTFDDVATEKIELENSEMKFLELAVLLKEGKAGNSDAEKIFNSYIEQVDSFNTLVNSVRDSGDTAYADELKTYLDKKIKARQNELKSVLPASPLYTAKSYLFEAEVTATTGDAEKAVVKQVQATQKLAEAQDLVEAGEGQLAAQTIGDYAKTVSEVKQEVNALPDSTKADTASTVANAIKDDKEILSSIQDVSGNGADVGKIASQVEKLVVNPIADNLIDAPVVIPSSEAKPVSPIQRNGEYGVPVTGTFDNAKPLDPLLDLNR